MSRGRLTKEEKNNAFDTKKYLQNLERVLRRNDRLTPEQSDFMKYLGKDKNYLKVLNRKMLGDLPGIKVKLKEVLVSEGQETRLVRKSHGNAQPTRS